MCRDIRTAMDRGRQSLAEIYADGYRVDETRGAPLTWMSNPDTVEEVQRDIELPSAAGRAVLRYSAVGRRGAGFSSLRARRLLPPPLRCRCRTVTIASRGASPSSSFSRRLAAGVRAVRCGCIHQKRSTLHRGRGCSWPSHRIFRTKCCQSRPGCGTRSSTGFITDRIFFCSAEDAAERATRIEGETLVLVL